MMITIVNSVALTGLGELTLKEESLFSPSRIKYHHISTIDSFGRIIMYF